MEPKSSFSRKYKLLARSRRLGRTSGLSRLHYCTIIVCERPRSPPVPSRRTGLQSGDGSRKTKTPTVVCEELCRAQRSAHSRGRVGGKRTGVGIFHWFLWFDTKQTNWKQTGPFSS